MNSNICWVALFLLCPYITLCQTVVHLFPTKVKEQRTLEAKKSYVEIDFAIVGLKVNKNKQIKLKEIVLATDNQGKKLQLQKSSFGDNYNQQGNISLKLDAPSRKARAIKSIKGVLKYYHPTENNKGKVVIKDYKSRMNSNLLKGIDDKIVLLLIDKTSLEEKLKENDAEIKQHIDKIKDNQLVSSEELVIINQLLQRFSTTLGSTSKKQLNFYAEGENDRIVSVNVYNKEGQKMSYSVRRMNRAWNLSLKEEMQIDWTIEILLENDLAIKEIDFIVENILLP